jgi:pimeloyl-ACP methyl ester carboxylesterase
MRSGSATGLAYAVWPGDDPPILAIHGISATLATFLELREHVPGRRFVAYDLRGRGRSAQDQAGGIRGHAADAIALAASLGLERPVLVGHSLGAYVAAIAAADWPGGVAALVLLDGGIWPPWEVPEEVLRVVLKTAVDRLDMRFGSVDDYAAYWRDSALGLAITPARRAGLARDLVPAEDGLLRPATREDVFFADSRSVGGDPEQNAVFDRVEAPVKLVRAPLGLTGDPMTQLVIDPVLDYGRPHIADLEVLDLDGASHYDMLEGRHVAVVAELVRRAHIPPASRSSASSLR